MENEQQTNGSAQMDFMTAIKTCFSKYATFSGRARRSEFWFFVLFTAIVEFACSILAVIPFVGVVFGILYLIFALGILVPSLAVCTRRLHDAGHSGKFLIVYAVPFVIFFLMFKYLFSGGVTSLEGLGIWTILMVILGITSFVLGIILLVRCCQDSKREENKWGKCPKA